jgi:tryptophan-rich sensory protein
MGRSQGAAVPFRPPPWAFGVAWPLLYLALGLAWALELLKDETAGAPSLRWLPFALCTAALTAYLPLRSCLRMKKEALWCIALAALFAAYAIALSGTAARLLLLPLLAWLCFAAAMSIAEFYRP